MNIFDNPQKASTYVYRAFNGDTTSEIDDSLKDNISRVNLLDMMTFDRVDFEKFINVKAKKKIKIESKWDITELGNISGLIFEKGKSITKQQTQKGNIPVVAGGIDFAYLHNVANREANVITVSASGANAGFVNFWDKPIWASDCSTIQSNDEKTVSIRYIYEELKTLQEVVYDLQKGNAQPHVYSDDIKKIKIPLPPIDIQQKIVAEVEKNEQKKKKIITKISVTNNKIYELLNNLYVSATSKIRLGDTSIFELSIGKRVLNSDLIEGGRYPVYSANVFEPFGYVNNLLINKFDTPSVIWGIDGDWMTNIIPANIPFYPTDHCGIIKILKKQFILEKYLAFALNNEGKQFGFSRTKRASIDRVSGITIPVPSFPEQQKIVAKIEKLEKQIVEAQAIIDNSKQQKQEILDKYLK